MNESTSSHSKLIGIGLAVVVIAIPLAIFLLQPDPEPTLAVPATSVEKKPTPARFGPGVLTQSTPSASAPANSGALDVGAPPGLEIMPNQHLVINKEMRDVFDYFLLGADAADRSSRVAKLQAHLKAKLPSPALEEASQIATAYLSYLIGFEKLMANEMSRPKTETTSVPSNIVEAERLSSRMVEISQMRKTVLGEKIAKLWYTEEEEGMRQSIAEMRQLNANPQEPNTR
ncbi:hypothetical protein BH11PSE11_BH11PSE11_14330 [soil metagenome]